METAGLPCQPNSRAGAGQFEEDPRFFTYIVWAAKHWWLGTIFLLLENVHGLKLFIIELLFGLFYHIWAVEAKPEHQGHSGVARPRLYILMLHRMKGVAMYDPVTLYKQVSDDLMMSFRTLPRDYMTATPRDIEIFAMRLASTRGIEYKPAARLRSSYYCSSSVTMFPSLGHSTRMSQPVNSTAKATNDMTYLLTDREKAAIDELDHRYERLYPGCSPRSDPDLVYFLGDNPWSWSPTWSAISGRIPTFRLNDGLYWFPAHKRAMCAKDKLSALGMPVDHWYCEQMGVKPVGIEDSQRAYLLAGNAMNFMTVAIVQLIGLSCFRKCSSTG